MNELAKRLMQAPLIANTYIGIGPINWTSLSPRRMPTPVQNNPNGAAYESSFVVRYGSSTSL